LTVFSAFWSSKAIRFTTTGRKVHLPAVLSGFLGLVVSAKASLTAEVLFLRKQLAFYQEGETTPIQ